MEGFITGPEITDMTVGKRLREIRLNGGMTQEGLAFLMRANLHFTWGKSTVQKVEHGNRSLKLREAITLTDVLGCDIRDLYSGATATEGE